ncbi:MAG: diaminohydroxyphosphoribosylaminopyrimidine deaminase, partial [bacterium]
LRAESGAIFVGTNTAIVDNPSLTTRLVSGRNPLRVLLDIEGKIPETHRVYQDGLPNLVLGKSRNVTNTDFIETSAQDDIFKKLSKVLYAKNMHQVLIEGGAHILNQCITSDFWDEIHVIQAPQKWGNGVEAPALNGLKAVEQLSFRDNTINIYRRN